MRLGSGVSRNRRRLAAALVGMPVLAWPPRVTAQAKLSRSAPTLNVKDFGAFGNGKLPDLRQVRAAIEKAAQHPAGAVVYFPPGDYYLGLADDQYLVEATKLQNVRFVGERATISCRSVQGQSSMLVLEGCRNITIEGLTFRDHGLKREID